MIRAGGRGRAILPPVTRRNVPTAYLASCLKNLQFFGAISVPFFIDWLRVDYTRLFALQAWFLFWVFTLEIPTGVVADKFGRKISVAIGCLLFGADMLVFGLVRNYPILFVGEFLGAIGMTLMSGAEQALLYDSLVALKLQDRARHYFSRYDAAGTLGMLLAFPVGSFVASLGRYPQMIPAPFIMSAASAALAAAAYLSMEEPSRTKPREGFLRMGVDGLRTLFVHRELRAYVLNAVTISAVTFFAFWLYQPIARRAGLGVAWLGVLAAGFNLFSTILLANSARLEALVGLRRLLFLSAVVPAALFAALGLVYHAAFIVPALFVLVGCRMIRIPMLNDLINRHIESDNRATVISAVSLLERFVTFALYPLVGWLMDASLDRALYVLAVLCAVFAVATRLGGRHFARDTDSRTPA
jgi:MFS family permease